MRNPLAWLEYNWNWAFITFCAVLLILAAALAVAGVRHHRREREAADYDAELDNVEDGTFYLPGPDSRTGGVMPEGPSQTGRVGEFHHDELPEDHPLHWPSIVAGLGPVERTRLEELTLTQRQAVRLDAWMASCRAGWDRARMEAAWAVAA